MNEVFFWVGIAWIAALILFLILTVVGSLRDIDVLLWIGGIGLAIVIILTLAITLLLWWVVNHA